MFHTCEDNVSFKSMVSARARALFLKNPAVFLGGCSCMKAVQVVFGHGLVCFVAVRLVFEEIHQYTRLSKLPNNHRVYRTVYRISGSFECIQNLTTYMPKIS